MQQSSHNILLLFPANMKFISAATLSAFAILGGTSTRCNGMKLGGYSQVDADGLSEPMLVHAAKYAVRQYITELPTTSRMDRNRVVIVSNDSLPVDFKILDAATQVVAGMNFKMRIELLDIVTKDCLEVFDVVVYDRFGDLSVTSFGEDIMECN